MSKMSPTSALVDVKAMRKTHASQTSSEKSMRLKEELATTAKLVSGVPQA
jgi:hypothetical protein